jgi:uncharacterized protein YndB with AHSA1/START domain
MIVSRSIHIAAPVERVFALMSDPGERSRLHPDATPIRAEIEGGGRLGAGSICHFRLRLGQRLVDYRTRVREFLPNRRIVSVSDSAVPFEITIETLAEDGGTRLSQIEEFEPTAEMLLETTTSRSLRLYEQILSFLDSDYAQDQRARQEAALRARLEEQLDRWLAAIKRSVED